MTDKLWDALVATAEKLYITQESVATGGSTTTLIDTVARKEVDDYWNEGTIWYVDANGAETYNNYCAVISDFDQDNKTFTWTITQTQAPAAGDRYIIATPKFPLSLLKSAINSVLATALVLDIDETVSTEDNKTEYALPTTIYRGNLLKVFYQVNTGDSNDNQWQEIDDWRVEDGDAGSADTLILFRQYDAGHVLQLHYLTYHTAVKDISGDINEVIDLQGLAIRAALWCIKSRMMDNRKDSFAAQLANDLMAQEYVYPLVRKKYKKRVHQKPYIERRDNT